MPQLCHHNIHHATRMQGEAKRHMTKQLAPLRLTGPLGRLSHNHFTSFAKELDFVAQFIQMQSLRNGQSKKTKRNKTERNKKRGEKPFDNNIEKRI